MRVLRHRPSAPGLAAMAFALATSWLAVVCLLAAPGQVAGSSIDLTPAPATPATVQPTLTLTPQPDPDQEWIAQIFDICNGVNTYTEALRLVGSVSIGIFEADLAQTLGDRCRDSGTYAGAIAAYQVALDIGLTGQPREQVHYNLAQSYYWKGDTWNALGKLRTFVDAFPNSPYLARAHQNIDNIQTNQLPDFLFRTDDDLDCDEALWKGVRSDKQGYYASALVEIQQALGCYRRSTNKVGQAMTLDNVGRVFINQGKYEDGLKAYTEALDLKRQIGDRYGEEHTLKNIGSVYYLQANYGVARTQYEHAYAIAKKLNDLEGEAVCLNRIGECYSQVSNYKLALDHYNKALQVSKKLNDQAIHALVLSNIGNVYVSQGKHFEALTQFGQAMALQQSLDDQSAQAATLGRIGAVYASLSDYSSALDHHRQALKLWQAIGNPSKELSSLRALGDAAIGLGRVNQAVQDYTQALAIARELNDPAEQAVILGCLGAIYFSLSDYTSAIDHHRQALKLWQAIGDRSKELSSLRALGDANVSLGQANQAIQVYIQTLAIARELNNQAEEVACLYGLGRAYEQGSYPQALPYYQQAIDAAEALRGEEGGKHLNLLPAGQLAELYSRAAVLYHQVGQPDKAFYVAEQGRARAWFEMLRARRQPNEAADGPAGRLQAKQLLNIQGVQALLDEQTTLISYLVVETQTLVFVIARDAFTIVSLPVGASELALQIKALRAFPNLDTAHPPSAVELYKCLIKPLRAHLTRPHLTIVPHADLYGLPFAALSDGRRYLMSDYILTYLPSASSLILIRTARDVNLASPLVLGYVAPGYQGIAFHLAQQEAQEIANLYHTQPLLGEHATEAAVRQGSGQAGLVHLAAVGRYAPDRSSLALAGRAGLDNSQDDGQLTVDEAADLKLPQGALVVLNSSETLVEPDRSGDVFDLTRALLATEAEAVVSNLWVGEADPTRRLMTGFHTYLRAGANEAEALQKAQIDLQRDYPNPFYWAGFVYTGGYSRKLPPSATPSNLAWLLMGVLISLAVVGVASVTLRGYPAYVGAWLAAADYPLQQLVPLLISAEGALDSDTVHRRLDEQQALCTDEQVRTALEDLVQRGLARRAGERYRLEPSLAARLHAWLQRRQVPALADRVRTQHPLYSRARDFFDQAGLRMQGLNANEFLLAPHPDDIAWGQLGSIYTRLVAGRPLTGDDFTQVCQAAYQHYGQADLAHRIALIIGDQRPEPGARYRLYEIRQKEGLAIVPLDSGQFDQGKAERRARDILRAEIDQATGLQDLYAVSGPVSSDLSFFGRERALQKLLDLLDRGSLVGLFGLRKSGKTSLIQRLSRRLEQRRPCALIDVQSTACAQGVGPFYPAIIDDLVADIQRLYSDLSMPELWLYPQPETCVSTPDAFLHDLRQLQAAMLRAGRRERLLLIVDEIDRAAPSGDDEPGYPGLADFFGVLRAAHQQDGLLDGLFVGVDPAINRRERWRERDNELYQALLEVWMPAMDLQDVEEMIVSLGAQMGVQYKRDALTFLARAGGGHPFITRQLCSHAIAGRWGQGQLTIRLPQAKEGLDSFIEGQPYLDELWKSRLNETQRQVLQILALADGPVARERLLPVRQRQDALAGLRGLLDYTLVAREADGYSLAWPALGHWIRWVVLGMAD